MEQLFGRNIKKDSDTGVFISEIFKNTFFTENLRATASERFNGRRNYKVFACLFCFIKTSIILYGEKTTIKMYLLQSAKSNVLENNFVLLQDTKIHHSAFHESFFVKLFFEAVFTTFSAVLKFREIRWEIARLKMALMFSLYSRYLF